MRQICLNHRNISPDSGEVAADAIEFACQHEVAAHDGDCGQRDGSYQPAQQVADVTRVPGQARLYRLLPSVHAVRCAPSVPAMQGPRAEALQDGALFDARPKLPWFGHLPLITSLSRRVIVSRKSSTTSFMR